MLGGSGGAELADRLADLPQSPMQVDQRAGPGGERVGEQDPPGGWLPGEAVVPGGRCAVDESREDGESPDAVGEHVVEDHDERTALFGQAGDDDRGPWRPVQRQAGTHRLHRDVVQCGFVGRARAPHLPYVPLDGEIGVVDPYRPSAQRRRAHERATQPRYGADPFGQRAVHRRRIERTVEDEQRSDLPRHRHSVHRELEQVVRTRPVDLRIHLHVVLPGRRFVQDRRSAQRQDVTGSEVRTAATAAASVTGPAAQATASSRSS